MTSSGRSCIIALDPGSDKCGYAVIAYDLEIFTKGIVYLGELPRTLRKLCETYKPEVFVIGNGTAAAITASVASEIGPDIPIRAVDERNTTYDARRRYFSDHPPKGFWRLIPLSLQCPQVPIDDYAALLIGEKYIRTNALDTE